ncbi:MAG: hypothetical protein ACXU93_11650 [Thermodesulfobacteriota bacterium]
MIGTGIGGTNSGFLTKDLKRTGRAGKIIHIGKSEELRLSKDRSIRSNNISQGLLVSNICNEGEGYLAVALFLLPVKMRVLLHTMGEEFPIA